MKTPTIIIILLSFLLLFGCSSPPTKVACVGDSITEGSGHAFQSKTSYPIVLASLLGSDYEVMNFGRGGTTMLKQSNFPYWRCKEMHNLFAYKPDVVILKLGTNDTKPFNWNERAFERDYQSMIDSLQRLRPAPKIYACLPVPVFVDRWGISDSTMNAGVIPIVRRIAESNQIPLLDLNTPMLERVDFFPDGVHPNEEGCYFMARITSSVLLSEQSGQ